MKVAHAVMDIMAHESLRSCSSAPLGRAIAPDGQDKALTKPQRIRRTVTRRRERKTRGQNRRHPRIWDGLSCIVRRVRCRSRRGARAHPEGQ